MDNLPIKQVMILMNPTCNKPNESQPYGNPENPFEATHIRLSTIRAFCCTGRYHFAAFTALFHSHLFILPSKLGFSSLIEISTSIRQENKSRHIFIENDLCDSKVIKVATANGRVSKCHVYFSFSIFKQRNIEIG